MLRPAKLAALLTALHSSDRYGGVETAVGLGGPAGFFVGAMFINVLPLFFFVGRQQYLKKNSKKPVNPGFSQNIVLNH